MCASGHGALGSRPQCGTCQELCLLLTEDSPAPAMEVAKVQGGPHFNIKGQKGRDVNAALRGQGEINVSWLLGDLAETGLQCYQQVAFAVVCVLHATSVAAAVCLGTHAPPKVFPTVSFASMWQCITSSLPQRGAPGFLQAAGIPPFALCQVLGHVQDQSHGLSQ